MAEFWMVGERLIWLAWAAWAFTWAWLSADVKDNAREESLESRLLHLGPLAAAVWLLGAPGFVGQGLAAEVFPRAPWMLFAGASLVAIGLSFATWARLVIGANWSGTVTLKQNHALVRHGPYALARHPIYSGLICAMLGTALAVDAWRGVLAFLLVTLSFLRKMRTEEAFMLEAFGDEYRTYQQWTAALIPMVW